MEKGLVSVVIPTYNRAELIERAADSVLDQDYPLIEVIVVDDGSRDDTAERMAKRYNSDKRVRFFRIPNSGVCGARNRGLKEVRGEYVAMLDSDDYWLPGKLSLQIGILEVHRDLVMVWSDMDAIDTAGHVVSRRFLRTMYRSYQYFPSPRALFGIEFRTKDNIPYYIGRISGALVIGNLVHTSTVVARADSIFQAGEYDQSVHPCEDQDYYYRVCLTGPVALIDEVTIHYQIGATDAASGNHRMYELATSAMTVFNRLRKKNRDNNLISERMIIQKETDLFKWVGEASFHKGRMADARRYLLKRVKRPPFDIRSLVFLLMACTPYSSDMLRFLQRLRAKRELSRWFASSFWHQIYHI
jgi:glycosyltransferase involved in cell wall biosynthesis